MSSRSASGRSSLLQRRGRACPPRCRNLLTGPGKGRVAGSHLIDRRPKRVEVGALADVPAFGQLRSQVLDHRSV